MSARAGKRARRMALVGPQAPLDGGGVVGPVVVGGWGGGDRGPSSPPLTGGAVVVGRGAVGEIFLTL